MALKWFKQAENNRTFCNEEENVIEKCSVYYIPCDLIRPNALRSRCEFDEDALVSLSYSIRRYGILEPLCVRKTDEDDSYSYELVFGERRLRSAKLLGFYSVPCIIIDVTEKISAEMSFSENVSRAGLDYFEVAVALSRMSELYGESLEELAERFSITKDELCDKINLLNLCYFERRALIDNAISEENAVKLAKISDSSLRRRIIEAILGGEDFNLDENDLLLRTNAAKPELPRDVSSVINGIKSRIKLLNRHKKRAELDISDSGESLFIRIKIKK